jgi:hypothetical protein
MGQWVPKQAQSHTPCFLSPFFLFSNSLTFVFRHVISPQHHKTKTNGRSYSWLHATDHSRTRYPIRHINCGVLVLTMTNDLSQQKNAPDCSNCHCSKGHIGVRAMRPITQLVPSWPWNGTNALCIDTHSLICARQVLKTEPILETAYKFWFLHSSVG